MKVTIAELRKMAAVGPYPNGLEMEARTRRFQVPLILVFEDKLPAGWGEATISVHLRDSEARIRFILNNAGQGRLSVDGAHLSAVVCSGIISAQAREDLELDFRFAE